MDDVLVLKTERQGYGLEQLGTTMTVRELIEFLEQFRDETEVFLSFDNGYTYGTIDENDFEEGYKEDFE